MCVCPKALFLQFAGVPPLDLFYKLGHSVILMCHELQRIVIQYAKKKEKNDKAKVKHDAVDVTFTSYHSKD